MFSLICVWINDWVNNREAGDLRRYRAHSDVIVREFKYAYQILDGNIMEPPYSEKKLMQMIIPFVKFCI